MPTMSSPLANDFQQFTAKGLREQLSDVISRVDPEDTPLQANISEKPAKGVLVEWQTDALRAAANNAQKVGFVAAQRAVSPTVRVGNYTQIMADSFGISGTLNAVEKAGRKDEEAYQLVKVGVEIKRDREYIILSANQGGYAGAFDDAPLTASLHAWIKNNVSKASDGVKPTYTAGVPAAPYTDGTTRLFTMAIVNEVMADCKKAGAKPKLLFVGPLTKQLVSTFATSSIVTPMFKQDRNEQTSIIGAADVIVTDFGLLTVITDLFQRERDAWFIDPSFIKTRTLRPYERVALSKRGDSDEVMVVNEWALEVTNEKALGVAYDLKLTA